MPELKLKCLIKWIGEEGCERVLCYHPGGEHYYCIALAGDGVWPFLRKRADVEAALKEGRALVLAEDPWASALRPTLPKEHEDRRDAAYRVIKDLVEDKQCLVYDRRTSGAEIRRVATMHGVHVTTVYKYLRRYWQRGAIPDALQPDLNKCGGRGKERMGGELKLGDVNLNGEKVGINVTKAVREAFDRAVEKYYKDGDRRYSFQRTYELMLGDSFAAGFSVKNGELTPDLLPVEKRPTFAQFRYYFGKKYRRVDMLRARLGANYVEQNCRAVTGDQSKSAVAIGDIYQIDATTADVYLVDSATQRFTVGRPIVYLAVDTLSMLVTGVHVTFEHMGYNAAQVAVWNAYRDKVEYCKDIGIEGVNPDHWPAKGLPYSLHADRGELLGKMSDQIVKNLGVMISNAPAYCPTAKAIVERHFGLLNNATIDWLPGAVPAVLEKRRPGAKDPRKQAALTLAEFRKMVVLAILAYNTTVREDYKLTVAMMRDGVRPIPCELWAWGLKNNSNLRDADPRKVRIGLLPAKTGVIRPDGISVGTLRYTCAKARMEQWFETQKARSYAWTVTCSYDPNLVDHVYLLGETFEDTQICDLTDGYRQFAGWSWSEVDAYRDQERKQLKALEDDKYQQHVAAQMGMKNIAIRAMERRKENGRPETGNAVAAQAKEKEAEGKAEVEKTMALIGATPLPASPMLAPQFRESKVTDEFEEVFTQRKQEEQTVEAK